MKIIFIFICFIYVCLCSNYLIKKPIVSSYLPAISSGGDVSFYGEFEHYKNITITIGNEFCKVQYNNKYQIICFIGTLNNNKRYDVNLVTNNKSWYAKNYYTPYVNGSTCINGNSLSCINCFEGWVGENCDQLKPLNISSVPDVSHFGGYFYANGFFGLNPEALIVYIGSNKANITFDSYDIIGGKILPGEGYHDINIYNKINNQLIFTGRDMFYYNPKLCLNNCLENGWCNNGTCSCYKHWYGNDCSKYNYSITINRNFPQNI
ncbi:hypothetical protein DICPUDRAFT_41509 [Dictyostelium purpureum]|uniref:EGF-like domain-containing protein n=1 Tax=Dictyostelium purpureum TaxID=5786 RepID=F1A094_DICPU|nr:uncharacterized protein DICPUDRAFT_41509 [Dictyostelium purpureum]EGC30386.1 hypothetical protein DICPUDRAFT_41509 [Dictyostelium purpureum]|eukprot:XP_003293083.1 hypothetical protein DICPUDRAFT_41509 [Dictyostelium purpureum]